MTAPDRYPLGPESGARFARGTEALPRGGAEVLPRGTEVLPPHLIKYEHADQRRLYTLDEYRRLDGR
jgi:hypothetical protein